MNIDKFLNLYIPSEQELEAISYDNKLSFKVRLENMLDDPDLPMVGDEEVTSISVENFKCFYNMKKEILDNLIKKSQIREEKRNAEKQELIKNDQEVPWEKRVEIEHTFINFIPLINKVKVDLLTNRESNTLSSTQYLSTISKPAHAFDNIDDFFLAVLFSYNIENKDFFKQEAVQKIIDRQFNYTRGFIKTLLTIYSVGFWIPQII